MTVGQSPVAMEGTRETASPWTPFRKRIFLDRYARKDSSGRPLERRREEVWRRVATGDVIQQGGSRRGAAMLMLDASSSTTLSTA